MKQHPEPEAGYMLMRQTALPAYNVQTAVDAEHALIVAHAVVLDASDVRCLKPMAEAAKQALKLETLRRRGCRLLQWRASRPLRSRGHDPVCSRDAHGQQSGRRYLIWSYRLPL